MSAEGRSNPSTPDRFLFLLPAGYALLAGAVRICGIHSRDFRFDESCTRPYASRLFDWPAASGFFAKSDAVPYYSLLRDRVSLFARSETAFGDECHGALPDDESGGALLCRSGST
jgi:hypothetical protein